jgi:hypothetical protein
VAQQAAAGSGGRSRLGAAGALLAVVLSLPLLGLAWQQRSQLDGPIRDAKFQLAGGFVAACDVIEGDEDRACTLGDGSPSVELYQSAIRASWWYLFGYSLLLVGVFALGRLYLYGTGAKRVARWCLVGALVVFVADAAENLLLEVGLDRFGPGRSWTFGLAAPLSVVKFAIFGPLVPTAAVIGSVLLGRWLTRRAGTHRPDQISLNYVKASDLDQLHPACRPDIVLPGAVADHSTATLSATVEQAAADAHDQLSADPGQPAKAPTRATGSDTAAAQARWRNASRLPPGRTAAGVGICASGGGIRSGCVTLGALQALRKKGVLQRADYLVSVSGGGYVAGAFQLALTEQPGVESLATPDNVFEPGSPEEDHLRRHGRYIADSAREWVTALAVLLRGVAASLALLTLSVVIAGIGLNAFYRAAPVVDVTLLLPRFDPRHLSKAPRFPAPPDYLWLVLAAGVAVAALVWAGVMLMLLLRRRPTWAPRLWRLFRAIISLTAVIAAYAVVLPAIMWAMAWLTYKVPVTNPLRATSWLAAVTTMLTWFGVLTSTLWRRVKKTTASGEEAGGLGKLFGGKQQLLEQQVATGLPQRLIVWAVLGVLAFVFIFVLAWTAGTAHRWYDLLGPALLAVLVAVAFLVDQTWFGLHPFYRRRLASAFAVRRAHMVDGSVGALPYQFQEHTTLSRYGQRRDGFPQVIFAAAAALSGQSRTPPGRRAVSFSFSADYVGGPDVGWVRTDTLEALCPPNLWRDVSVQAAMAVSGAAFASAMGRQASAIQTLLALSNARLGTWLPNPGFLATLASKGDQWTTPRLPTARRLPYHLAEVIGTYPAEGRLLLCTDGGHYENLGLVELLRHRCRTIYAIDASGDAPPLAATLAEAITLAYEELGVEILVEDIDGLVPGSATPLQPAAVLEKLNARLSKQAVATGRIKYPQAVDFHDGNPPSCWGTLVIAKTALTPDLPYELRSFALKEPSFPRQSTGDQFLTMSSSTPTGPSATTSASARQHVAPKQPANRPWPSAWTASGAAGPSQQPSPTPFRHTGARHDHQRHPNQHPPGSRQPPPQPPSETAADIEQPIGPPTPAAAPDDGPEASSWRKEDGLIPQARPGGPIAH